MVQLGVIINNFEVDDLPLMKIMFFENDKKAYNDFLIKRKITVKEFILNSILHKDIEM